ncbi:MAG: hypothetical protein MJY89_08555 [Bacteroidales bacterium]|nr:hypothetical protein [Bacteroidales bacterium]
MEDIIIVVSVCVVMPVIIMFLALRPMINKNNAQKEIILAALQNNSDCDIEQLVQMLNSKKKLLKEKLLGKLLGGSICFCVSLALFVIALFVDSTYIAIPGSILLAVGIAFIANYFVGKKMLAKEIEAEERQKTQE